MTQTRKETIVDDYQSDEGCVGCGRPVAACTCPASGMTHATTQATPGKEPAGYVARCGSLVVSGRTRDEACALLAKIVHESATYAEMYDRCMKH